MPTRRRLLQGSAGVLSLAALFNEAQEPEIYAEFPRQEHDVVKAIVGASHGNLDRVQELVSARPALAKASWDWGYGDWETAIGAASHMGRPDIAELLIEYGARPTLFTHAMMGHIDVVQATVEAMPGVQKVHGPHGIPLLQHARNTLRRSNLDAATLRGAQQVVDYLTEVGGSGQGEPSNELSDAAKQIYLGAYRYGSSEADVIHIELSDFAPLAIRREGADSRALRFVEEHGFAPSGAPAVRIRFAVEDSKATRLTVHDPEPVLTARRVA